MPGSLQAVGLAPGSERIRLLRSREGSRVLRDGVGRLLSVDSERKTVALSSMKATVTKTVA
jgi:hypothetical protein